MSTGGIQDTQLTPRDVTIIMSVLIVLFPWGIMITRDTIAFYWILWSFVFTPTDFHFSIHLLQHVISLAVLFIRIFFSIQLRRLYRERGSIKRVLSIGVLVEYLVVFYSLISGSMVYSQPAWGYVIIGIPTPFLLLYVLYLLKRRPPPRYDDSWLFTSDRENLELISSPNPNHNGN